MTHTLVGTRVMGCMFGSGRERREEKEVGFKILCFFEGDFDTHF